MILFGVFMNQMGSPRHTRSEVTVNEDMVESFRAMARAVREQATATTLMAQQMANDNSNGNGNIHDNGHGEVDYEYMKFMEFRSQIHPVSGHL